VAIFKIRKNFPFPLKREGDGIEEEKIAMNNLSSLFFFISQRLKLRKIFLSGFLSRRAIKLENLEWERGVWSLGNKSEE